VSELSLIRQALAGVVRQDFIDEWLSRPNAAFSGDSPLELIERGDTDRVWQAIFELESGVPT
jgi:hypothetical protein